jgi:beta-galactosidase
LRDRYKNLELLNDTWGTSFWSLGIRDWNEIELPHRTTSFRNPAQVLDYRRFMNQSLLNLFKAEIEAIRATGATQLLFTNAVFGLKALDGFEWGKYQDVTAIDMYIDPSSGAQAWKDSALWHDLTRSWGRGKPYFLVEQTTSQVNWRTINSLKAPGTIRTLSYQALARGASSVMFFQWRASRSGAEKYHAGMVPHYGVDGSRIFAEVKKIGEEFSRLDQVAPQRVQAQVGILFSYENIWALEIDSKPALLDAWGVLRPWYQALIEQNIPLDFVHPDDDLGQYKVLIAPLLYQISEEQVKKLKVFVQAGGTLLMTYFSGITDLNERIWLGGYPALLQDVLGIKVEEWQPFQPGETNSLSVDGKSIGCSHWADLLHTTTAEMLARYAEDFYAGRPALTCNHYGAGTAYYAGTLPDQDWLRNWIGSICADRGVDPLVRADPDVEAGLRAGDDGASTLVLVNHSDRAAYVDLLGKHGRSLLDDRIVTDNLMLNPYSVLILELQK